MCSQTTTNFRELADRCGSQDDKTTMSMGW